MLLSMKEIDFTLGLIYCLLASREFLFQETYNFFIRGDILVKICDH